jgi:hypothetical protein
MPNQEQVDRLVRWQLELRVEHGSDRKRRQTDSAKVATASPNSTAAIGRVKKMASLPSDITSARR